MFPMQIPAVLFATDMGPWYARIWERCPLVGNGAYLTTLSWTFSIRAPRGERFLITRPTHDGDDVVAVSGSFSLCGSSSEAIDLGEFPPFGLSFSFIVDGPEYLFFFFFRGMMVHWGKASEGELLTGAAQRGEWLPAESPSVAMFAALSGWGFVDLVAWVYRWNKQRMWCDLVCGVYLYSPFFLLFRLNYSVWHCGWRDLMVWDLA